MLILTRRVGENLMIGDDIIVSVLGVKGNQVRIGIDAPKDVSVHREEIYERIRAENPEKPVESMADRTTPEERLNKGEILAQDNRYMDTDRNRKPVITRRKSTLDSSGQIVDDNRGNR